MEGPLAGGPRIPAAADGLFVTGTDTGVGKTVVAAAIAAALIARGRTVVARKPVITGLDEPVDPDWPPDHVLLGQVTGTDPEAVALRGYGPAVSPHLAAELAGARTRLSELLTGIAAAAGPGRTLIVEGVGGLLVPLGEDGDVRALAAELGLPLVIVARPGLGTINHTLLTVEAARSARLPLAGIVLTPWPDRPQEIERSNRDTLERMTGVQVATLPVLARGDPGLLARAGNELPLSRWLATPHTG